MLMSSGEALPGVQVVTENDRLQSQIVNQKAGLNSEAEPHKTVPLAC
jgi:hypothetical protein